MLWLYLGAMTVSNAYGIETKKEMRLQRIEAIANMYAYARYFYPNKYAENLNWYKFLTHVIRQSDLVADEESFNKFLQAQFSPLVPEMKIRLRSEATQPVISDTLASGEYYIKEHYGLGEKVMGRKSPYYSRIIKTSSIYTGVYPNRHYTFPLNERYVVQYPVAVRCLSDALKDNYRKVAHQIDSIDLRVTRYSTIKAAIKNSLGESPLMSQDGYIRIADLIMHWCVLKHFYPYLEEDGLDDREMRKLLYTYVQRSFEAKDLKEYYFYILREFMGNFHDEHIVLVSDMCPEGSVATYVNTEDNQLFLEYVDSKIVSRFDIKTVDGQTIRRGDVLVAVQKQPIESFVDLQRRYISAATRQAEIKELLRNGFPVLDKDSTLIYSFKRQQGAETVDYSHKSATRDYSNFSMPIRLTIKRNQMIQSIIPEVYYVNISPQVFRLKTFVDFVQRATQAKAYIIDLREYPAPDAYLLLGMLSEAAVSWGDYRVPKRYLPHQQSVVWEPELERITPNKQQIKAPCYFLINAYTNSYGESMALAVKKNHLGTLVGTSTSGTNGNMGSANLKMFNFTFSVGKDFEGFHGKGVAPDIFVSQSQKDFLQGKDSAIETILSTITGISR